MSRISGSFYNGKKPRENPAGLERGFAVVKRSVPWYDMDRTAAGSKNTGGKGGYFFIMKIGILCASDTELAPFLPRIQSPDITEKAMLKFYAGRIGEMDTIAVYSGVCKVNAAVAAQLLIDTFHVDGIINAGTAGGMAESVQLFDTVISDRIVYHDVAEDILTEFHPWLKENYFESDRKLFAAAQRYSEKIPYPVLFGTMATGEQFIEDEKRGEINEKYAPLSVDMETAAAAHVCYVNSVPFLSVRTITDTAEHKGAENFEKNCETASERAAGIVIGILEELCGETAEVG